MQIISRIARWSVAGRSHGEPQSSLFGHGQQSFAILLSFLKVKVYEYPFNIFSLEQKKPVSCEGKRVYMVWSITNT